MVRKMRLKKYQALIWGVLGILIISACASQPSLSDFQVGESKEDLMTAFGEPARIITMVKSGHINGPIETLWYKSEDGTEIEVWSYDVIGGVVELYFVGGSDQVTEIGFLDRDAVY